MELEYGRPLPPELLVEMHKCLPLDNQIYILVNVSKTFVINNSTRMHRNIERIRRLKKSLKEYIYELIDEEEDENGREILRIADDLEWKPEFDALLRYGAWLTSTRQFLMIMDNIIEGMPKNFVEELLLHMAYSCWPKMMLQHVGMNLGRDELPIPTFMKPLLNKKKEHYQIGRRIFFESIQLEMGNGQILHIYDAELRQYGDNSSELILLVMNKTDGNNWFRIIFGIDSSKEFIRRFEFSKWNMQSFDVANFIKQEGILIDDQIEQNGNKLEAISNINWDHNLDMILRLGAGFTQFRHFEMKQYILYWDPDNYVDFLISSISNTKHPENFLESVEMNFQQQNVTPVLQHILDIGLVEGIPKGGKLVEFGKRNLHILSAKIANQKNKWLRSSSGELEFTLANGPTNGAYVFDFVVKLVNGSKQIVGIKIQKRKTDAIAELKCEDQIGFGKKRKTNDGKEDDENGPTCSAKLMKQ